jgi:malonate-semialdehyde dehydrogenase (acetylating) / methylmalonate-semialdehyde dehydrogenase
LAVLDQSQSRPGGLPRIANLIFRRGGHTARELRDRVEAGMVGVNVPVAQPFTFFPFSGWKGSFYGDLHVHGTGGIEFYTCKKMFIARWSHRKGEKP